VKNVGFEKFKKNICKSSITYFFLLVRLVKVLQDDGDVHVDDDHEVNDDEGNKVYDGYEREPTVSIWLFLVVWITVWGLYHQRI